MALCRDFTFDENDKLLYRLNPFYTYKSSLTEQKEKSGSEYLELDHIITLIDLHNGLPEEKKKEFTETFFKMFYIDGIIANSDRHNGNWGFLANIYNEEISFAPIYDNATSFFVESLNNETINEYLENDSAALFNNIMTNNFSRLTNKGARINYSSYIRSCEDVLLNKTIYDTALLINNNINNIVKEIRENKFINGKYKSFFLSFINISFNELVLEPYKKICEKYNLKNFIENKKNKYNSWEEMEEETGLDAFNQRYEEAIIGCYEYQQNKQLLKELNEDNSDKKTLNDSNMER